MRIVSDAVDLGYLEDMKKAAELVKKAGRSGPTTDLNRIVVTRDNARMLIRAGVKKIAQMPPSSQEPTVSQRDKGRTRKERLIREWLTANAGKHMTIPQIADSMGYSSRSTYAILRDQPGAFVFVRRGVYEVRDPSAERAAGA